jgi:hypothetical protein
MRYQESEPEPGTAPGTLSLIFGLTRIILAIPVTFFQNQELKPKVLG